jgi:endonuclease/exonuclease/phosphatase family metal-dependent hydrolase
MKTDLSRRPLSRAGIVAALLGATAWAGGAARQEAPGDPLAPPIILDGDVSEWPENVAAIADGDFLYIRTSVEGPLRTLQAMQDRTLELWIDADSNARTGTSEGSPRSAAGLGVDLEVRFSPVRDGRIGNGVAVSVPAAKGERITLGHAAAGAMFLPTYAAPEYEIRLSRHMAEVPGGLVGGPLAAAGRATLMLVLRDAAGIVKGWADPFTVDLPDRSPAPPREFVPPPAKSVGEVRVMAWNIHRGEPQANPKTFGRLIRTLAPDVLLLQEWDEGGAPEIAAWLDTHVGGLARWNVIKGPGGVAVASPHAMNPLGPRTLTLDASEGASTVRFVAAVVGTPAGPMLTASIHLKCCGFTDSDEDRRRLAEARAINRAMSAVIAESGMELELRVLGGDFNLVGSRPPLDALRAGLDVDGSELEVVDAMVWGDRSRRTWADATNEFSPGRLDFLVVGESAVEVVRSFVVDLSVLGNPALAGLGLEPGTTDPSDHLPVVVDLRAR